MGHYFKTTENVYLHTLQLKILGTGRVTWNKFDTDIPQLLDATVQNVNMVIRAQQ